MQCEAHSKALAAQLLTCTYSQWGAKNFDRLSYRDIANLAGDVYRIVFQADGGVRRNFIRSPLNETILGRYVGQTIRDMKRIVIWQYDGK